MLSKKKPVAMILALRLHDHACGHENVHDHGRDQNAYACELHLFLPRVPSECELNAHGRDHENGRDDGRGHGDLMQNVRGQNISR